MLTQLAIPRTDLPPPRRQLLYDERPVGWLARTTMGFFGFADAEEAMNAAWVAYRTVSRKSAPILGTRPTPIDTEPLGLEWRDGRETIVASGRSVASLVRPVPSSGDEARWFGFEIELAPKIAEPLRREIMRTAHRALLKSGVRWSLVRPAPRALSRPEEYVAMTASPRWTAARSRRRGARGARFRPAYVPGRQTA